MGGFNSNGMGTSSNFSKERQGITLLLFVNHSNFVRKPGPQAMLEQYLFRLEISLHKYDTRGLTSFIDLRGGLGEKWGVAERH